MPQSCKKLCKQGRGAFAHVGMLEWESCELTRRAIMAEERSSMSVRGQESGSTRCAIRVVAPSGGREMSAAAKDIGPLGVADCCGLHLIGMKLRRYGSGR